MLAVLVAQVVLVITEVLEVLGRHHHHTHGQVTISVQAALVEQVVKVVQAVKVVQVVKVQMVYHIR